MRTLLKRHPVGACFTVAFFDFMGRRAGGGESQAAAGPGHQRRGYAHELARDTGVSAFVGDGSNRWPAVHRLDAAHLFQLAVESAAAGSRLHGVGEEGVPLRDIAEAIGRHLNLPVVGISSEEAGNHFGWFAQVVSLDNPTSSALTQERLG